MIGESYLAGKGKSDIAERLGTVARMEQLTALGRVSLGWSGCPESPECLESAVCLGLLGRLAGMRGFQAVMIQAVLRLKWFVCERCHPKAKANFMKFVFLGYD